MQSLNVFSKGIAYLENCLAYYTDSCAYFLLFLAGIVYIWLKGTKEEKAIFLPSTVFLLLTVYNPICPVILDHIFDVNSEYYRLFWIAPVIVLIPYLFVKLIGDAKSTKERAVVGLLLSLCFLLGGRFLYSDGYKPIRNIYQMPPELLEVSELIHADSDSEYSKAFFEYEYNMQMRQYDPKILLTVDREDYMYAVSDVYSTEMLSDPNFPQYKLLAVMVRGMDVGDDVFLQALEDTKTEYIVLTKGHFKEGFLDRIGLRVIGQTQSHVIYKYDLKEPYDYELVDYSDVKHIFSFKKLNGL